jgi:signal peptidase I
VTGGRPTARTVLVAALVVGLALPYVPLGVWVLPDTGSMDPATVGCDVLVYTPATDVAVGDVVVYDPDWRQGLVVHRVVAERDDGYVLAGDNNSAPDPGVVSRDQFVAEVRLVVGTGAALERACAPVSAVAVDAFDGVATASATDLPPLARAIVAARPVTRTS